MVATELNQHGTQGTIILSPTAPLAGAEKRLVSRGHQRPVPDDWADVVLQGFWLILPFGVLELSFSAPVFTSALASPTYRK